MNKLLVLLALVATTVFSQDLDKFVSLKSQGSIPLDFTTLSTQKFEEDHAINTDKELDKNFFLSTRFYLDELLLSGMVIFNDPVSDYIHKVADHLLEHYPELKSELRFYVLKTDIPNAFSTDQGVVLVTTGLMAQLENEAQLAYILAHEITHYIKKHVRNGYIEQKNVNHGKYGGLTRHGAISHLSQYSKDLELEADKGGIDMFFKTDYDPNEIFTVFDVLLYSYLPFDDVQFDTGYFNSDQLRVPGSFFPDTIREVSQVSNYNDDNQTHPNIEKRVDVASEYVASLELKEGKKFILPEKDFQYVRDLCRFENINSNLTGRAYTKVLYDVYLLKLRHPDNRFLDLAQLKALYGLMKYKNASRYSEVTLKTSKVEGESYKMHVFFKELTKAQLNVLVMRYAIDMNAKYPNDPIFKLYVDDVKKEFALKSGIHFEDLKSVTYDEYLATATGYVDTINYEDSISKIESSETLSKYEKIRLKKELKSLQQMGTGGGASDQDFHLFGLADMVKEGSFIKELKAIKSDEEDRKKKEYEELLNSRGRDGKGTHLGIDNVVVVNPMYENYKLNAKQNHLKSEDKKLQISEVYTQKYDKLNIETQLVDSKNLGSGDVDEFNDLALLTSWISEIADHDDIDMISSCHDQVQVLTQKYGTSHFLFSGIFGYKERTEATAAHLYGILLVYTAPIALIDLLIVHNYFDLVAISINADTDEVEFTEVQTVNLKGIDRILKGYVYDVLYQLSSKPKSDSKNR